MSEVDRQMGQVATYVNPGPGPRGEASYSKGVPELMQTGAPLADGPAQSEATREHHERPRGHVVIGGVPRSETKKASQRPS